MVVVPVSERGKEGKRRETERETEREKERQREMVCPPFAFTFPFPFPFSFPFYPFFFHRCSVGLSRIHSQSEQREGE